MAVRVEEAAQRLRDAATSRVPCAPVRDLLAGGTVDDAYAVAQINVARALAARGVRISGWKAGLTSQAVQRQVGVDTPDFGALLSDCGYGDGESVPLSRLLQPRVEAEVAFVLGRDLPDNHVTAIDVLRSTEFVVPSLEIVDSRVEGWDITILDTVADNASSGLYSVGLKPTSISQVDLAEARMTLTCDGTIVSQGIGSACLGHPVNAVVWLANTLASLGTPLRAGDVVLSGALGPIVSVTKPGQFEATIDGLGTVRTQFVDE